MNTTGPTGASASDLLALARGQRRQGQFASSLESADRALVAARDEHRHDLELYSEAELALATGEIAGPAAAAERLAAILDRPTVASGQAVAYASVQLAQLYRSAGVDELALAALDSVIESPDDADAPLTATAMALRAAILADGDDITAAEDETNTAIDILISNELDDNVSVHTALTIVPALAALGRVDSGPAVSEWGVVDAIAFAAERNGNALDGARIALAYAQHAYGAPAMDAALAERLMLDTPARRATHGNLAQAAVTTFESRRQHRLASQGLRYLAATSGGHVAGALTVLERAATIDRNMGDDEGLARDLLSLAIWSTMPTADAGPEGAALRQATLGLRHARRSALRTHVYADLLETEHRLRLPDLQPSVALVIHRSSDDSTVGLGHGPGPAGEVAVPISARTIVWCDAATGWPTRLIGSDPVIESLIESISDSSHSATATQFGFREIVAPASHPLLRQLAELAAISVVRTHTVLSPEQDVLLSLQRASAIGAPPIRDLFGDDFVSRLWTDAHERLVGLSPASRALLTEQTAARYPQLAEAFTELGIQSEVREGLEQLRQLLAQRPMAAARGDVRTHRAPGPTGQAGEARRHANRWQAAHAAVHAAVAGHRGVDAAELWMQAARAWDPHDRIAAATCRLNAGSTGFVPEADWFAAVRRPATATPTWDTLMDEGSASDD